MKRANGNGSVVKLKGKRRRPYCARITEWVDTDGGRIQRRVAVGYFKTRPEAEEALYRYCQGYVDPKTAKVPTLGECFEKAVEISSRTSTASTVAAYRIAYGRFSEFGSVRVDRVTPIMLQERIEELSNQVGRASVRLSVAALNRAFEYALRMQYITANPTASLDFSATSAEKRRERTIFSPAEIEALRASSEPLARVVLMMIYTGMRLSETINLRMQDVDLGEQLIRVTKSKTSAGVRTIPIAPQILEIVRELYCSTRSGYLVESSRGRRWSVAGFKNAWNGLMEKLGMDHIPHETRHTFATLLYNANVDEVATKAIIGHTDINLTRDVYTHESLDNLRDAIRRLS